MTRTDNRNRLPEDRSAERYGQFETRDALVIYDRQDTSGWLQSDIVLSLDDVR